MPPDDRPGIPISQASQLLTHFATFLTLAIHSLLYHRALYPPNTFLTARAYNLPVQQSRHPGVCRWVSDAVSAVVAQLRTAAVERVVFVVHQGGSSSSGGKGKATGNGKQGERSFVVLERWIFDVAGFPEWPSGEPGDGGDGLGDQGGGDGHNSDGKPEDADEDTGENDDMDDVENDVEEEGIVWDDINEALRGALGRLANTAEKMPRLPDGCPFTLAIELRDEASPPIGVRLRLFPLAICEYDINHPIQHSTRNHGYPHSQTSNLRQEDRLLSGASQLPKLRAQHPSGPSRPALYFSNAGLNRTLL